MPRNIALACRCSSSTWCSSASACKPAYAALSEADAVLVAGSSLMVYSGFRFVQAAVAAGKPVAAVNLGRTRADDLLALKVAQPVGEALTALAEQLVA